MIAVSKKSIENMEENLPSPIKNRLSYEVLNKDLSDSG